MIKHTLAIALLALSLAACGGKSKPAVEPAGSGEGEEKVAADCCCEFIEETMIGDGSEDTAENQVTRLMSGKDCEGNSGTCVGADACSGSDEPVE